MTSATRVANCWVRRRLSLALAAMLAVGAASAAESTTSINAVAETTAAKPLGIALEAFDSPFPVQFLPLSIEGQDVRMAYMDVAPDAGASADGGASAAAAATSAPVVLLLHGKNFFGAYWEGTIRTLTAAGFRVIVPDQIGFGKSSKPDIHYSFHGLAANTKALLNSLGITRTAVVGHSMGGMLATRFTLLYPDTVTRLVLENPIGLEDYRTTVPYSPISDYYREGLKATPESTRKYFQTYFPAWQPEYERWVDAQYRMGLGGEGARYAWSAALTTQMIYEQPVVHEFPQIRVPTLLIIGQADRTTIGRNKLSPEALKTMGQYPALGKRTAAAIPGAKLDELDNVGHIPHLQVPERFHPALVEFLNPDKAAALILRIRNRKNTGPSILDLYTPDAISKAMGLPAFVEQE